MIPVDYPPVNECTESEPQELIVRACHPILNFDCQGGITLDHFATRDGNVGNTAINEVTSRLNKCKHGCANDYRN